MMRWGLRPSEPARLLASAQVGLAFSRKRQGPAASAGARPARRVLRWLRSSGATALRKALPV